MSHRAGWDRIPRHAPHMAAAPGWGSWHIGSARGDHPNSAHTCPGRRLAIEAMVNL